MPFFFMVPVWLMAVLLGIVLTFFVQLRRLGFYVIAVPTGATVISFLLSTAVLYLVPRVMPQPARSWYGILLIVAYIGAMGAGALFGAITGFLLVRRVRSKST
jgi:hypothetical protein